MKEKILFIGHRDKFYGAESVLLEVIGFYAAQGHQCDVALPLGLSSGFSDKVRSEGLQARIVKAPYRIINPRWWLSIIILPWNAIFGFYLLFYAKLRKVEVIYSNTCLNIVGAYLALLLNKKHLWHFHEQPTSSDFRWIPTFLFPVYRYLLRRERTTVIFISKVQKELWEQELGMTFEYYVILYNPPRKLPPPAPESGFDGLSFGFLGSFTGPKNVLMLQDCFMQLKAKYPEQPMRLLIMGNGPLKARILQKAGLSEAESGMKLIDYSSDVKPFYDAINVLVLPSVFESWGLTALEAISLKKATIVTCNTALSEILRDGQDCTFIDPNTPMSLFNAMESLVLKPALLDIMANTGFETLKNMSLREKFEAALLKILKD